MAQPGGDGQRGDGVDAGVGGQADQVLNNLDADLPVVQGGDRFIALEGPSRRSERGIGGEPGPDESEELTRCLWRGRGMRY